MSGDDVRPERLNDAIDELVSGRGEASAAASLSESLRPLLAAAASLWNLRRRPGPRPSFVLGLEEQLRADMRLQASGSETSPGTSATPVQTASLQRIAIVAALVVLVALLGAGALVTDRLTASTMPDGPIVNATGSTHEVPGSSAEWHLDLGWRRLLALESLLPSFRTTDAEHRQALIAAVVSTYAAALEAIEAEDDARLALRAGSELRVAKQVVGRAGDRDAPPIYAAGVRLATADLDDLIDRADALARRLVVAAGTGREGSDVPPATPEPSWPGETAAAATAELLTSMPPDATPTVAPTLVRQTATPVVQTATPTPLSAGSEPSSPPPLATATPQDSVRPGGTPAMPTPSNTPGPEKVVSTVTPDSWPVTSTPPPTPEPPIAVTQHPGGIPTTSLPTPGAAGVTQPAPDPTTSGRPDRP